MHHTRGIVVVSATATVAALLLAVHGLIAVWPVVDATQTAVRIGVVLCGIAAVVVLTAAVRARDRRALAVGTAALAFAVAWWTPGPVGSALYVVAQAALLAFGLLTVRMTLGVQRTLGWIVTVAAAGWFVTGLLVQTVAPPTTAQEVLVVVFAVPSLFQTVASLGAAVLVAVPVLRQVGRGAAALWSSAEVR